MMLHALLGKDLQVSQLDQQDMIRREQKPELSVFRFQIVVMRGSA